MNVKKLWLVAAAYWLVMSVLVCVICPPTISDTMARYAPMADAFARGEWRYAFHPRFGVIFQVVSGSLAGLAGLRGDMACQSTALLFLALSIIPAGLLAKRLFDERIAWLAVVAILVSDEFTRLCYHGLRDPGKCLAFALIGWGMVEERDGWLGVGLLILSSLVSYGFALGAALFGFWFLLSVSRRRYAQLVLPFGGWLFGTLAVTVMVHAYTGHWVPVPHFIRYVGEWL